MPQAWPFVCVHVMMRRFRRVILFVFVAALLAGSRSAAGQDRDSLFQLAAGRDLDSLSLTREDLLHLENMDAQFRRELDVQFLRELASIYMTELDSMQMARWYAPRRQTPRPIVTLDVRGQSALIPPLMGMPPAASLTAILAELSKPDTTKDSPWKTDVITRIGGSQAGYRNWTKGGVNTLAITNVLEAKTVRSSESWEQRHELRLVYGLVRQDTLPMRKADDEIRLHSSFQHKGEKDFFRHFNPTAALQVRTQFAPGYNHKKNPFASDTRPPPVRVSDVFAPITLTQTIGLSYEPEPWFSQRVGIAAKQTIVSIPEFRELYGVDSSSVYHMELGVESRTYLDRELVHNVRWKSTLGLFAAFNNPDLPDLQWENVVAMQVNQWLGVNFQLDMFYDRDLSNTIQVKEVFSLGFSFTLI